MAGMRKGTECGFTLVELMIVLVIGGLLLTFSMPTFNAFKRGSDLKTASHNIANQLVLAHDRAISSGVTVTLRFMKDYQSSSDYHVWSNNVASPSWRLPGKVTYSLDTGTQSTFRMTADGRCMDSGFIILKDDRGDRDTLSIRLSGLVIVY